MLKIKLIIMAALLLPIASCLSTGDDERGVTFVEEMTESEFIEFQLYTTLTIKIAVNRLLENDEMNMTQLDNIAKVVEAVRDGPIVAGATSLFGPALESAGFTNNEVTLVLLLIEQQLIARGLFDYIDPITGLIALSPRTKDLLTVFADSLRTAWEIPE